MPYKRSKNNSGPKSTFTAKHEDCIKSLIHDDSQLFLMTFTEKCVFIDEAGFHSNKRNSWARSPAGTRAAVKTSKTRVTSHSVDGATHSSAVLHIVLKKPSPKPKLDTVASKKRKGNSGKKKGVAQTNDDEGTQEDDISVVDVKTSSKRYNNCSCY